MAHNFTTSANIIRDTENDLFYIPTPNTKQIVNQITNDFKKGIRSFNLIGNYGTGKSSFLLALEQSLRNRKRFFEPNFIKNPDIDFIKIIGSYNSIIDVFADHFEVKEQKNKEENIFFEIFNQYHELSRTPLLFLFIDEFGKFLEYAAQHNPEKELYFIQQLAEFCNNPKYNIVLITTVHQSFESYSHSLSSIQRQEWLKVKGRFREIVFNEPVEQLLFLAAQHLGSNPNSKNSDKVIKNALSIATKTKAFDFNVEFINEIASKLYPLDILAASVLTLALQRYGQNERSLFSFLESTDHTSISRFNKKENSFYNLAHVYDYLNFNFYSYITSKYNPDFALWMSIRNILEEIEREFPDSISDYSKIIKSIGLINIFAAHGSTLDKNFYKKYLTECGGINHTERLMNLLEDKKIILYRKYEKRYVLYGGTDLDIQSALIDAGNSISEVTDLITLLNRYYNLPPVFAKHSSYITGTPRFFEFKISDNPIATIPTGEIDGYINLIFNNTLSIEQIEAASANQEEAIIYGFYTNAKAIKDLLFEIEKTRKVLADNENDKVATKELTNIITHQTNLLNHYILSNLYNGSHDVVWIWQGRQIDINSKKEFNHQLSRIISEVYNSTPIFKNELVNKHKLSGQIHSARKNYLKALVNSWSEPELGFDTRKFPPEKTIYLSLLKDNGLSPFAEDDRVVLNIERSSSFFELWQASERFIESAVNEKKGINEFVEILSKKPFKLKQGFIDFWLPTYLFLKKDNFALFNINGFIPNLSEEVLDLVSKNPEEYEIKAFNLSPLRVDIFNSYRTFLGLTTQSDFNNNIFIETIKPFLVFYKQLPPYVLQTEKLSVEAKKIRTAIALSQDPEKTFFEDFPIALGFSLEDFKKDNNKLKDFTNTLKDSIHQLRTAYDELINRFEEFLLNEIIYENLSFTDYKKRLQERYKKLKKHLLLPFQKTFIQRLDSELDDKKAWLNSIAQSVVSKPFDNFTDDDEYKLYDKFKTLVLELDGLTNLSKSDVNESTEDVIGVKIDSFFNEIEPKVVRIPRKKAVEIERIKNDLKEQLSKDKTLNIAALANLLKDLLQ